MRLFSSALIITLLTGNVTIDPADNFVSFKDEGILWVENENSRIVKLKTGTSSEVLAHNIRIFYENRLNQLNRAGNNQGNDEAIREDIKYWLAGKNGGAAIIGYFGSSVRVRYWYVLDSPDPLNLEELWILSNNLWQPYAAGGIHVTEVMPTHLDENGLIDFVFRKSFGDGANFWVILQEGPGKFRLAQKLSLIAKRASLRLAGPCSESRIYFEQFPEHKMESKTPGLFIFDCPKNIFQ